MSMFREAPTAESPKGQVSIRRVIAAFFAAISVPTGLTATYFQLPWQSIACAFGIPVIATLLLLFFTTWNDIAIAINMATKKEQ